MSETKPAEVSSTEAPPAGVPPKSQFKPCAERLPIIQRLQEYLSDYARELAKGNEEACLTLSFTDDWAVMTNSKDGCLGIHDGDGVIVSLSMGMIPELLGALTSGAINTAHRMGQAKLADRLVKAFGTGEGMNTVVADATPVPPGDVVPVEGFAEKRQEFERELASLINRLSLESHFGNRTDFDLASEAWDLLSAK